MTTEGSSAAPGGYRFDATKIRGFSLTHLSGTGCAGASGDIPFFPHVGEVTTSPSADTTDAEGRGRGRVAMVPLCSPTRGAGPSGASGVTESLANRPGVL